jgi:hypothetical protein
MKLIAIALLSAGLALPVVVEKPSTPKKEAAMVKQQKRQTEKKKKTSPAKKALKKAGKGLLSAVLFVAEPER